MKNTIFSNVNVECNSLGGFFQPICTKVGIYIQFKLKFDILKTKIENTSFFWASFGYFGYLAIITLTAMPLTEMLHHLHIIKISWF